MSDVPRHLAVVHQAAIDSDYASALAEWITALDEWNKAGEPASGPEYDRMDAARNGFPRSEHPE
jgi:hypothetical protein